MSLFAIRDDDTSFFTSPEDIDNVYAHYWGEIPVSFAVVPFSVPVHRERNFNSNCSMDAEMPLGENDSLVNWLKMKIKAGHIEVMLHGYSHRYRQINGRWVGEFGCKPQKQLVLETAKGKAYLETLLETKINIFVPPSNTIGKAGVHAIRECNLNLSGVMGRGGDRPFTLDYPFAYLKRWGWRLINGDAYPFPLHFGGHKELRAYALTPRADEGYLMSSLEKCARWHAPFVLATHYWEFSECPAMHATLTRLIERARKLNMNFSPLSCCYGG